MGSADIGYRMIARSLVERLPGLRAKVEVVVLRPPTFRQLEETLSSALSAGNPFQVVHFDGHGVLRHATDEGMLVFERPSGGAEPIAASEVARVIGASGVPLVVMNACQSGAIGKALEGAVATPRLTS
jgi:CHAT domain-containing protein